MKIPTPGEMSHSKTKADKMENLASQAKRGGEHLRDHHAEVRREPKMDKMKGDNR